MFLQFLCHGHTVVASLASAFISGQFLGDLEEAAGTGWEAAQQLHDSRIVQNYSDGLAGGAGADLNLNMKEELA